MVMTRLPDPDFPSQRAGFTHAGPVRCPACGHRFRGEWSSETVGELSCPACGHTFPAMWPGFDFSPVSAETGLPLAGVICPHCGHEFHGPGERA
jgi:DNA-directed RNA polymerase subunit RPC12/RpoP